VAAYPNCLGLKGLVVVFSMALEERKKACVFLEWVSRAVAAPFPARVLTSWQRGRSVGGRRNPELRSYLSVAAPREIRAVGTRVSETQESRSVLNELLQIWGAVQICFYGGGVDF
jgi:hypothetical protein